MLSLIKNNRQLIRLLSARSFASQKNSTSKPVKENWDLCAGVLVERLPVTSKPLNAIEQKFQTLLWQQEFEGSLKSDHELKHERDIIQAELIKKGEIDVDLDDSSSKQTAQDLKDAYVEEFKKFQLASRATDADAKNDIKSTDRALDDSLYLIEEQKSGDKTTFALPQGQRQSGETMRQTAERVLKEKCGTHLDVRFYGNAPCAFYKYKYPASMRKDTVGAKVFIYRTTVSGGNVDPKITNKYEWQPKEVIAEKMQGTRMEFLQKMLF